MAKGKALAKNLISYVEKIKEKQVSKPVTIKVEQREALLKKYGSWKEFEKAVEELYEILLKEGTIEG